MISRFNEIFGQKAWFGDPAGKGAFEIGYPPADSPDENDLPLTLSSDGSQRPPLNVIDLRDSGTQGQAKERLADFISDEIRYLIHSAGIRIKAKTGDERALNHGDIAVLVRSQGEFQPLADRFTSAAIPHAYYRQPGLFQCRQAHWLSMVLKAISNPQHTPGVKLALLTPFFDIPSHCLEQWPELPAAHLSQQLLAGWQTHASQRRWGRLFQSMMEDSGLMLRHCNDAGWDRCETNYLQLFDYLETAAHTQNMDIVTLVAHLDSLRLTGSGAGADADIHQIEDEGDKVQILTMHVSKGLEFPVVFIAGGLTMRGYGGIRIYHDFDPQNRPGRCRKVVDLTGGSGLAQARQEFEDEYKRLYYVALTRARAKLYVPFYPDDRNMTWIGPICKFVSRSIADARVPTVPPRLPKGQEHVDDSRTSARGERDQGTGAGIRSEISVVRPLLPAQTDFRHRKLFLESFSSIGHRLFAKHGPDGREETFSLIDEWPRDDDERAVSPVLEPATPSALEALPGGTEMGSMFHNIFETIDFQAVMDGPTDILENNDLRQVVATAMDRYAIDSQWAPSVAQIVAHTLRQQIAVGDSRFCMGQLLPAQRRHEVEFFFPFSGTTSPLQDQSGRDGKRDAERKMVIRGFIDLLFSWQDRFYIADWKSNRLTQGYHQDAMDQEMQSAGYDLQYQLYSLSTLRWLSQCMGRRFDPHRHFGGVLYLFIRGMEKGAMRGVFHVPPDQLLPLESLEKTIRQKIAGLKW